MRREGIRPGSTRNRQPPTRAQNPKRHRNRAAARRKCRAAGCATPDPVPTEAGVANTSRGGWHGNVVFRPSADRGGTPDHCVNSLKQARTSMDNLRLRPATYSGLETVERAASANTRRTSKTVSEPEIAARPCPGSMLSSETRKIAKRRHNRVFNPNDHGRRCTSAPTVMKFRLCGPYRRCIMRRGGNTMAACLTASPGLREPETCPGPDGTEPRNAPGASGLRTRIRMHLRPSRNAAAEHVRSRCLRIAGNSAILVFRHPFAHSATLQSRESVFVRHSEKSNGIGRRLAA